MPAPRFTSAVAHATLLLCAVSACTNPPPATTSNVAPTGTGPRVVWDIAHSPFPAVPLPNDIATIADPTSPTGVRVNASMVAPTAFERALRSQFDELDGWGTFMPVTVAFDQDVDVANILARHQNDEFDFRDDVIYLVNLSTGIPVPLDIGNGNFPLTLNSPQGILPNDPRAGTSNLVLSTLDEDTNGDGILELNEDTNFDGVMQRAAVFPAGGHPEDDLTTFWEPEGPAGGTLIVRPIIPLESRTRYAVVLTDRLVGTNGPVRSPFATLAHPDELGFLAPLANFLTNPDLASRFYGHLAWSPAAGAPSPGGRVTFAWTFMTESTTEDLFDVRAGLYGTGPYAGLSAFDPQFTVARAHGGAGCPARLPPSYTVSGREVRNLLAELLPVLGITGAQKDALVASYDWVDYVYIAQIQSPYLLGNPQSTQLTDHWDLQVAADDPGVIDPDGVQLWVYVPIATATATQPFPVLFNAHGYGEGALQSIAFGGYFAQYGIATVAANAPAHGSPLTPEQDSTVRVLLSGLCLQPWASAVLAGRSRDLDGDGIPDNGGDFLSAEIFHTRDMVRQTAVDYMQIVRALTEPSYSQPGLVDYDGDGTLDAPGDLNGDGVVDVGGMRGTQPVPFYMWGESLGGITSMVLGGVEPAFTAVAPISGGAGLVDVSTRSDVDGVAGAVVAPILGPAIVAIPTSDLGPVGASGATRTSCATGSLSLRFIGSDVTAVNALEFGCTSLGASPSSLTAGDDVVALNVTSSTLRCARVPADGRLFLPLPADVGDPVTLTIYAGSAVTDYGSCATVAGANVRRSYASFEVGEGDCDQGCGHVPPLAVAGSPAVIGAVHRGDVLVSRFQGLALKRQTSTFRQFLQLAQAGIDPGDPVNYAPLFFLSPQTSNPHPILAMSTIGDTMVPIATGNTFARAAGLEPFIRGGTGTSLDEYVAPDALWNRYQLTPDDVLVHDYVIEGLSRLDRWPVALGPGYLLNPDSLDDGNQPFGEVRLVPPMRLVRAANAVRSTSALVDPTVASSQIDATWAPQAGVPEASFINAYVIPTGVHTFYPSDPSLAWDVGAYLTNLVAHFFQSAGTDVWFYTHPATNQCLEGSNCDFIPQRPIARLPFTPRN